MSHDNPYASPIGGIAEEKPEYTGRPPLATRGERFVASILDTVAFLIVCIPVLVGFYFFFPQFMDENLSAQNELIENIFFSLIGMLVFLGLHGYLLARRGQTLGKVVFGLQIRSDDDQLVPFSRLILKRYLIFWLIALIPVIGNLIVLADALAIFRGDRKCLHDDICGTKVIKIRS